LLLLKLFLREFYVKKTAIYVDFDNIYGAVLDRLGISADPKKVTVFQLELLKEVLKNFFRELKKSLYLVQSPLSSFSYIEEEIEREKHYCLCVKVFAEYEMLPLSNLFSPSIQIFLHNTGVTPLNPFIAFSKSRENRNAADLALALSVIEDVVVKRIPAEAIIVCTCDIDLYPLLVWLREHTGKEVYLGGFSKRTNSIYDATMTDEKILMDKYLEIALRGAIVTLSKWWFSKKAKTLREEDLDFVSRLPYIDDGKKEELKLKLSMLKQEEEKVFKYQCSKFEEKIVAGLRNWLKKEEYATTGLIIESWLPKWNLELDVRQANECLKNLILSGNLEQEGIFFEKSEEKDGFIIGKFRRKKDG
jgi:hypothetical protein